MNWPRLRHFLKEILDSPTAPFHEYHVRDTVLRLLSEFSHVSVAEDGFGNLVATYCRGRKRGRFAFGAHMDHPGWVRDSSSPEGAWKFLGGMPAEYLKNPVIEEFGAFGMWKIPAMELRDGIIYSRACDDLINCATILAMFDELENREIEATCYGLFTRAEEVGFVGAIKLAKAWPLPKDVAFVSLETSSPAGDVVMGGGPVLRVGDRRSVFDDSITRQIGEVAAENGIGVQRRLLYAGSCEATAFQAYGIPSGGISVALGNYHNCGANGRIEAEYVSRDDTKALVELIVALVVASASRSRTKVASSFRREMEKRAREFAPEERATRRWFGGRKGDR